MGNGYEALEKIKGVNKNAKIYFGRSKAVDNLLIFSAYTM